MLLNKNIQKNRPIKSGGFTLIELLIVISITTILISSSISVYGNLQPSTELNESAYRLAQIIRKARNYSLNGYINSSYGVFVDEENENAIFYKGSSFASRDSNFDEKIEFRANISVTTDIPGKDINFSKWSGFPSKAGLIRLNHEYMNGRRIIINSLGVVDID